MIRQSSARKAINVNKATSSKQKKQHASQWKAKQNKARQNKAKPNKHCFKKPSIPKLRKTKNGSGWKSKGQKTINKKKQKEEEKEKKEESCFQESWSRSQPPNEGPSRRDNLSEKELQVVDATKKKHGNLKLRGLKGGRLKSTVSHTVIRNINYETSLNKSAALAKLPTCHKLVERISVACTHVKPTNVI